MSKIVSGSFLEIGGHPREFGPSGLDYNELAKALEKRDPTKRFRLKVDQEMAIGADFSIFLKRMLSYNGWPPLQELHIHYKWLVRSAALIVELPLESLVIFDINWYREVPLEMDRTFVNQLEKAQGPRSISLFLEVANFIRGRSFSLLDIPKLHSLIYWEHPVFAELIDCLRFNKTLRTLKLQCQLDDLSTLVDVLLPHPTLYSVSLCLDEDPSSKEVLEECERLLKGNQNIASFSLGQQRPNYKASLPQVQLPCLNRNKHANIRSFLQGPGLNMLPTILQSDNVYSNTILYVFLCDHQKLVFQD